MKPDREEVLRHFVGVLESLDEDREDEPIEESTLLIGGMNWRSVEIVYLANEMQEHYGQTFPFNDLFEEVSKREPPDITVGEWVTFIHEHLGKPSAEGEPGAEGESEAAAK